MGRIHSISHGVERSLVSLRPRLRRTILFLLQVDIQFKDEAIREIARVAAYVNKTVENIGARRLHTVLERIVEVRPSCCSLFSLELVPSFKSHGFPKVHVVVGKKSIMCVL